MKIIKLLKSNDESDWLIAEELIFKINNSLEIKKILETVNDEIQNLKVSFQKKEKFLKIYRALNEKLVTSG